MIYNLFIATPEEVIYDGGAKDLKAPGGDGYFEVLSHHAPMISTLKEGEFEYTDANDQKFHYKITGGILEIDHNKVSVLIDSLEPMDLSQQ
jgi:F-type H+-transporting ATPase subunit epsilon